MIVVDINTFLAEKSGGIGTYHREKATWFRAHPEHRYYLVRPGPRHRVHALAENVFVAEVYGPPLSHDPGGYRLMLDYARVLRLLRSVRPDVVEAGDPWLTGMACLLFRRMALLPGLLSAFYHADPIRTWAEPWVAAPGPLPGARSRLAGLAGRAFYGLQRRYPVTVVTSSAMEERLRGEGVARIARLPFGTETVFFDAGARREPRGAGDPVRLLYVGRLGREKGMDLLLRELPLLLALPDVRVSVVGRGSFADAMARIHHPRFEYRGFVADRAELARIYGAHDVLLAPGEHETFGLCVLEAMAAGLVVVGPDAGGTGDFLREMESPFAFAPGDEEGFHQAVLRAMAADPATEVGRSRALACRYGCWSDAIGRLVEFYSTRISALPEPRRVSA